MKKQVSLLFLIYFLNTIQAQNLFPSLGEIFKDDIVPRIDIIIPNTDLNTILDPINANSNTEYSASFIFDNGNVRDTLNNVGFRLRGNTSRNADKKSFKVSFNTFESGRKYYGLEKLNLNGEHNDPSIARSKICWDLLRDFGVPAPRSNHVDLYINGAFYGLYMNVEHIDEEFVEERFGNQDGNLYKCTWPVEFKYISNNPNDYKGGGYELKTNLDANNYADLSNFISVLNQTPIANLACELEKVFNVDNYIKVMVIDVMTANWDGPIWNKNNCYIYKNSATGKFEYIPFDLDNTFGISWFPNIDWGTRNIYQWSHSSEPRPLYNRILQVQEYKDRYSYYMNQLLQNHWSTAILNPKIDQIKTMISPSAQNDSFRILDYGFTYQEFIQSFDQPINHPHTTYGIKNYIQKREQFTNSQLVINDIYPIMSELKTNVSIQNQTLHLQIQIRDNQTLSNVKGWASEDGGAFTNFDLFDDGLHLDELANDGIFGGDYVININSGDVSYYVEAIDNQSNAARFPRCEDISFSYNPALPKLVINEILASNETILADEAGEFDDWIELYNADSQPINLTGKYLSDNPNEPTKWELPNLTLATGDYLLIWADENGSQGNTHANFKLSKNGETIGIYSGAENNFAPIDEVTFPAQTKDVTYGRLPNGTGDFQILDIASPSENNEGNVIIEPPVEVTTLQMFPNPFSDFVKILHPYDTPNLKIFNSIGEEVFSAFAIEKEFIWYGKNQSGILLGSGTYFIVLLEIDEEKSNVLESNQLVVLRK